MYTNTDENQTFRILLMVAVGLLLLYCAWYMICEFKHIRDESEYKDIMETEVSLLAQVLAQASDQKQMIDIVTNLKYFPDGSGRFFILDYEGNLYCHGESGFCGRINLRDQSNSLPFNVPHEDIVSIARDGGGYIKYDYYGVQHLAFIQPVPNTKLIVGSSLGVDHNSKMTRKLWKLDQKLKSKTQQSTTVSSPSQSKK